MPSPLYQLRFYEDTDYDKVADWFAAHGASAPPKAVLPRLGAICQQDGEDVAALWLYMDNSVGVCWAEYPVTRPKLSLRHAKDALMHLFNFIRQAAKSNNYGLIRVNTLPAIARFLEKEGFIREQENVVSMFAFTEPQEEAA